MGFRDQKLILKTKVDKRINAVVNRLNSGKREEYPDLAAEREAYEKEVLPLEGAICMPYLIRLCSEILHIMPWSM